MYGKSPPNQTRGKPAAGNAPEIGYDINHHYGRADLRQMQTMLALQIVRNPEKIKPPDRVNHELSRRNRPSLLVRQKLRPFDLPGRRFRVALYVFKFALGAVRMLLRCTVEQQPKNQPGKAESAGQEESPAPAQMDSDPGHNQRRDNCADVRAGVENSRRQCTLFLWEPFRNALDARRENSRFAEPQGRAGNHKATQRICHCMSHGGKAPENHGDGVTYTRAQAVNQAAHKNHAYRVSRLKGEHQMPKANIIPAKLVRKP